MVAFAPAEFAALVCRKLPSITLGIEWWLPSLEGGERQSIRLLRKLLNIVWYVYARQFTRCPDMDRGGHIKRIVQRSTLDADRLRPALGLMPES